MTLIEKVRDATNIMHKQLDGNMMPEISKIKDAGSYARLLSFFYSFYKPVYDNINTFLPADFLQDYAARRKPGALLTDLHTLNINAPIPICDNIPLVNNAASAIGALYVLEGSAMGGMVLKKMIANNLHDSAPQAFHFFGFYGNETAEKWSVFVSAINAYPFTSQQQQEVVNTANDTFKKLDTWLQVNQNIS